ASKTDADEAYMVGKAAVEAAIKGTSGKMVTLQRISDDPYQCTTSLVELEKVANGEKMVPAEFISENGFGVTEAFRAYATPLILWEAPLEIAPDGLPVYARLAKHMLPRKTAARK
ncbi:MAG: diphosphate--fructose-6-phosphate 1-phosphotransferase, partial [Candidatus Hydrogenedentes bacterium]|nr:diphosphate--fructose-6-phosphate 1-phosphotransferase [Candidatus Hydrogenedentota bacterium]